MRYLLLDMKISELKPTESRLLLNPYKLTGRELVISAISELLFFNLIRIKVCEFDSVNYQILEFGAQTDQSNLREYQRLILGCVKDHYSHYPEPKNKESSLTPDRLLRDVYGIMNFNYFKFKRKQIIGNLQVRGLLRSVFPFYYIKSMYTEKGRELVKRLKHEVKELENYYLYYKNHEPGKIKEILKELGPNILLAYNIQSIIKELRIWKDEGFFDTHNMFLSDPVMIDLLNGFKMPDLELPSFEFPSFDFPDGGTDLPIFGND